MFLKHQTPDERLNVWRDFRHLSDLTVEKILVEFSNIKVCSRCMDFYTPDSWPTVFEIVREGYFCQSGITLVLTATLYNAGIITSDEITFYVISNHITGSTGLVLEFENQVYNAVPGKTISVDQLQNISTIYTRHTIAISKLFS